MYSVLSSVASRHREEDALPFALTEKKKKMMMNRLLLSLLPHAAAAVVAGTALLSEELWAAPS